VIDGLAALIDSELVRIFVDGRSIDHVGAVIDHLGTQIDRLGALIVSYE